MVDCVSRYVRNDVYLVCFASPWMPKKFLALTIYFFSFVMCAPQRSHFLRIKWTESFWLFDLKSRSSLSSAQESWFISERYSGQLVVVSLIIKVCAATFLIFSDCVSSESVNLFWWPLLMAVSVYKTISFAWQKSFLWVNTSNGANCLKIGLMIDYFCLD